MINESILGRRFRFRRSCGGHRISPLAPQYQCPRQALLIITTGQAKAATTKGIGSSPGLHPSSSFDIPCFTKSAINTGAPVRKPLATALSTLICSRCHGTAIHARDGASTPEGAKDDTPTEPYRSLCVHERGGLSRTET